LMAQDVSAIVDKPFSPRDILAAVQQPVQKRGIKPQAPAAFGTHPGLPTASPLPVQTPC